MKISIITPSLNNEATIQDTLNSVKDQSHQNFEHIIIDGQSTDGTLSVIEKNRHQKLQVVSEKDSGIYAAINKGIALATGDYIGILNADDVYYDSTVLQQIVNQLKVNNTDCIYGDLLFVKRNDPSQLSRVWKSGKYTDLKIKAGWTLPHPTFFVRKEIYETMGVYNEAFQISGDYEMTIRLLLKNKISSYYHPDFLVVMRTGGKSNESLSNKFISSKEDRRAWEVNNLNPPFLISFLKPIKKIPQFLLACCQPIFYSNFSFPEVQLEGVVK